MLWTLWGLGHDKSLTHSLTHKSQSHSLSISPSTNYLTSHHRSNSCRHPKLSPPSQAMSMSPLSLKRPRRQAPQEIKHLSSLTSPCQTFLHLTRPQLSHLSHLIVNLSFCTENHSFCSKNQNCIFLV